MSERVTVEGSDLGDALNKAVEGLEAQSIEELAWELDKEHFRKGAFTVKLDAWIKTQEEIESLRAARRGADVAKAWMTEALKKFGSACSVNARMSEGRVHVRVVSESDASLLIGREGKNIRALQQLLTTALRQQGVTSEVKLDVESPDDGRRDRDDRGRGRDRDDRGRGRGRDRDDRGRGRDRDRSPRGGRDERPPRRDRDDRPPRRDRDDRPPRRDREEREERDPKEERKRDEDIQAEAREAAQQILDGEESVRLGRMNSYERHVAHSTIKAIDGVDSRSVGRGSRKKVEVFVAE
jgi:predicted RNA-binding protein Jag